MNIYYDFDKLPHFKQTVITVGSFDGVHSGHRMLLRKVVAEAKAADTESIVVTFEPHPREVLAGGDNVRILTSLKEKIWLLAKEGIDNLVVARFTPQFAALTSEEFVRDVLCARLHAGTVVAGFNHRFGSDRQAPADRLERLAAQYGFKVCRMDACTVGGQKVSSTVVRGLIDSGDIQGVAELLGHPYFIVADVVKSEVMIAHPHKQLPPDGSYRVKVDGVADELYVGVGRLMLGACSTTSDAMIEFV